MGANARNPVILCLLVLCCLQASPQDHPAPVGAAAVCVPAPPTLFVMAPRTWGIPAGTPVVYSIELGNNDSASCSAATFNISVSAPGGWTVAQPASATLTPGSTTGSLVFTVTSPAGLPDGSYGLTIAATNSSMPSISTSVDTTYTIDHQNDFVLFASAPIVIVPQGSSNSITVSITALGAFNSNIQLDVEWNPTIAATLQPIEPTAFRAPGSGSATLNVVAQAPAGDYLLAITATGAGVTHSIEITARVTVPGVPPGAHTLFSATSVPNLISRDAGAPIELGMKFTADQDGSILGIRFYKGPNNTGPHVGNLWSSMGQLLGSATFSGETASGWQQAMFTTPVPVKANNVYVVSYHSSRGYSVDLNYFNSAVDNPPLHAVVNNNFTNGNGVYAYGAGSSFPNLPGSGADYWVDTIFTAGTVIPPSLVSLAVTPPTATIHEYGYVQLHAVGTYSDNSAQDLSGQVTWSSNAPTIALVNGDGVVAGGVEGTAIITAALFNLAATATVTVVPVPPPNPQPVLTFIHVSPLNAALAVGDTQQYLAMGTLSTNAVEDITSQVTWSSSSPAVATITSSGLVTAVSAGSSVIAATLNGINGTTTVTVTAPPPPPPPPPALTYTLFDSTATPNLPNLNAGGSIELGLKFTADRDGSIVGIRFYKGANNTGTHVANLWTSTGQLLASATFTNEINSGWQQANFAAPVAIKANTVYVASYHTVGGYSLNLNQFNSALDNPPLHAVVNNFNNTNGVYAYSGTSTFPTSAGSGANYWVDVVFTTGMVISASLASIDIAPPNPSVATGATQQFHATGMYSDTSTQDLTSQVSWSSGTPSVATIAAGGLASGLSAGSSQITASVNGISGTATLTVTAAPPPPPPPPPALTYTLFDSTATPNLPNLNAGGSIELGLKFTADRDGSILGIRFYKGANNTGTHVANLWTSTGQQLASATFTNEANSGWQQVYFAAPVAIMANTVYIASYHTAGGYSLNLNQFTFPLVNPPLHAVVSNYTSANGVYAYCGTSTFPNTPGSGANYWVDVIFQ